MMNESVSSLLQGDYYSRVGWLGMVIGSGLGFAMGRLGSFPALAVFVLLIGGAIAVDAAQSWQGR